MPAPRSLKRQQEKSRECLAFILMMIVAIGLIMAVLA